MTVEDDAKKVLIQKKHEMHEEFLTQIIQELQATMDSHSTYAGPESIFAHVKATTTALLFLCQERKRDRDKRGTDYGKPVTSLPPVK